jgi:hypothetical protein
MPRKIVAMIKVRCIALSCATAGLRTRPRCKTTRGPHKTKMKITKGEAENRDGAVHGGWGLTSA